jgi:hypothetical protein
MMSMDILKKFRRHIAGFSLAVLMASTFAVSVAQAATFDDVQPDDWFYTYVEALAAEGVLNTSFSNYRPGDNANRAEAAKLLVEAFDMELVEPADPTFSDVAPGTWYYTYVETAAANGVVGGYKDAEGNLTGMFGPGDPVTRAQYAKMATLAAPLAENMNLDPSFPDVQSGDWFYEYVLTAFNWTVLDGYPDGTFLPDKNINRAEIAKITYNAMNPVERTELPGPPTEAGDLSVALDGSSPDSTSIPKNGANVLYSVFKLTASADEDVRIDELIISRVGLGLPGDFDSVKLYVDGVQQGSEKTMNTSTNSATFSLAGDPIIVPAGSSVLVEVRADMAGQENSYSSLCIAGADSILAFGEASGEEILPTGAWAVCGEEMNTSSASVGNLEYEVSDYTGEINVGDTGVSVARLKLNVDSVEDADLTRITLKQKGSADVEDFANPTLYLSGSPVDSAEASWQGDFLTFDLSGAPLFIERGNSRTLELRIDVVGGLGNDVLFDVYRDWHIEATGRSYGFGLNVTEVAVPPALTARDIVGGNLALSTSASNPVVGDVMAGAEDHEFLAFNLSTGGDGVTVRGFDLDVVYDGATVDTTELQDVKIWTKNSADNWVVIAGPLDPNDGAIGATPYTETLAYNDSFTQAAGVTKEYVVTADVENDAPNGAIYRVEFDTSTIDAEYESNGDSVAAVDITGGTLVGKDQTVADPTLDVTLATVPSDQNIVGGKNDVEVAGWNLQASSASDIKVTSLTVTCTYTDTVVDGDTCADVLSNASLYLKKGSTRTLLQGGKSLTSGTAVFNSLNLIIPSGEAASVVLRVNTSTAADGTDTAAFNVAVVGDIIAEDVEFNTLAAGQKTTDAALRTITFVGAGTLTVSLSGTTPEDDALLAGAESEPVTAIKFAADENEDVTVQKLRLTNNGANDDAISQLSLYDGTTLLGSTIVTGSVAEFTGLNIVIPADGQKTITVSADTNLVGSGLAASGDDLEIGMADVTVGGGETFENGGVDVKAVGNSSGELVTLVDSITAATPGNFIIYNTLPTITRSASSPTSGGGTNVNMLTLDITNEGQPGDSGIITRLEVDYAGTCAAPATFTPYRSGNPIGTPADNELVTGEFNNGIGIEVDAGQTVTIELHADNSACTVDETLAIEVVEFDWDDGEAVYTADATNNFLNFDLDPTPLAGHLFKL